VTGASRGIGYAIAHRLAQHGCAVAICARDGGGLERAAREIESSSGRPILGVPADMAEPAARQRLVDAAVARFGTVHILVNNAGTHKRGTLDDFTEGDLEQHLREKLFGSLGMIRAVLPVMRRQRDGRIVNVIGQAGRHPHPDRLLSGVTNAACLAMTKSVADAFARDNIRVNSVCPQYIEGAIIEHVVAREMRQRGVDRAAAMAGFTRANVLGRLGTADEVARLVAFLVSDRAPFVCGTSVNIDGGYQRYVF